jgi:hypothetical protein
MNLRQTRDTTCDRLATTRPPEDLPAGARLLGRDTETGCGAKL